MTKLILLVVVLVDIHFCMYGKWQAQSTAQVGLVLKINFFAGTWGYFLPGVKIGSKTNTPGRKNWWPHNSPLTPYTGRIFFRWKTKQNFIWSNALIIPLTIWNWPYGIVFSLTSRSYFFKWNWLLLRQHLFAGYFFNRWQIEFSGVRFATGSCWCYFPTLNLSVLLIKRRVWLSELHVHLSHSCLGFDSHLVTRFWSFSSIQ